MNRPMPYIVTLVLPLKAVADIVLTLSGIVTELRSVQ